MRFFIKMTTAIIMLMCNQFNVYSNTRAKYPISDHYNGVKFYNSYTTRDEETNKKSSVKVMLSNISELLKWQTSTFLGLFKKNKVKVFNTDIPPQNVLDNSIRISFIGHLTFLIQTQGVNILTDPVYSDRASPVSFLGPKRYTLPGIKFENLPRIDLILISHNHYDHMDIKTLKKICKLYNPIIAVPLGNAKTIHSSIPYARIVELDWWETFDMKNIDIHLVPAKHWSSRILLDHNKSLWGSFIVESKPKNNSSKNIDIDKINNFNRIHAINKKQTIQNPCVCVLGDTAYSQTMFKDISNKFQNIVLSIIPIGAYKPRWIMRKSHMSPYDAALTHMDLKSKYSIPSHYNTFNLSQDSSIDQINDFKISKQKYNIKNFEILDIGSSKIIRTNR